MNKRNALKNFFAIPLIKFTVSIAIFLASAALFGLIALNLLIKQGEKVTVPNVVNKKLVEALDLLSEHGLELRKSGARNSSFVPEDAIVSQDPLPGSVVKKGAPVSVIISLGSKICMAPDLAGKTWREAQVELTSAGLKAGRLSRVHNQKPSDIVLAQSPAPNQQIDRNTPVDVLISLGPRKNRYRVPDYSGHSLAQVSQNLKQMGIQVGDIVNKVDLSLRQGTVLDQAPRPGSLVHQGDSVSLVVTSLRGEDYSPERKQAVFIYQVPYGFWNKPVRIEVTDPEGTRIVYNEIEEPGAGIRVAFAYSDQCSVKVYLNNALDTERTMR